MIALRSFYHVAAAALLAGFLANPLAADTITVSGAVLKPGEYQWHEGARLQDAAVAGQVSAQAWPLGAALLRHSAIEPQQRLKAGVLYDLRANRIHAQSENNAELQQLLERLKVFVQRLPVTGRVVAELNPFQLLLASKNDLLEAGDELIYPLRPDSIRVLGAVTADCQLTFDAQLQLKDYLGQCPVHRAADRNYVHVIQPDGTTKRIGMAHWNQQQATLAVGAIIYVPFNPAALSPEAQDLNKDMAALLATQYSLGGRFSE
ncbi:Capsule biosynthesis GfcC [Halopseudomonas litoralis]|uniref:Capsule biosynthesis GfcC n=1 Tax=Halopseudomonas litoralis TaxID=797277 RepID=A0A1H1SAA4_9GAMM|nr:capsule biosynthesis GfcC family protein [Halopseudomonas litoralis]SDS45060.1 Capsule biosynthesis GfcC [Halopseudomonas litoralis]